MSDSTTVQIDALLLKFHAGDAAAKGALIDVAKERLMVLTSKLLGGFPRGREHDDTTGIFNESYLRLHSALEEVKPKSVRQFLGLAALEIRRTLLDVVRKLSGRGKEKRGRKASLDANDAEGEGRIDVPISDPARKRFEMAEDLFAAMDRLPEELREVVMLHHFQGLMQSEVAALLGVHEDTVKRKWATAQVKLAKHLAAYDPAE